MAGPAGPGFPTSPAGVRITDGRLPVAPREPEGDGVKIVTALVRPHALDAVRGALERHAVLGMTITEVGSHEPGHVEIHRGARIPVDVVPRLRIETVVDDDLVDRLLDQLLADLEGSDARLWVRDVDVVLRVRTGERAATRCERPRRSRGAPGTLGGASPEPVRSRGARPTITHATPRAPDGGAARPRPDTVFGRSVRRAVGRPDGEEARERRRPAVRGTTGRAVAGPGFEPG